MTIGAAPRSDLTGALRAALDDVDVIEVGALDDLPDDVVPPPPAADGYPLTTRRRDGRVLTADEAWLGPRVAEAIDRAQAGGASVLVLLCAGGFASVTARRPLIRPFDVAISRLRDLGARRIGVLVPIEAQVVASRAKWTAAGFDAVLMVGTPADVGRLTGPDARSVDIGVEAIVLDYVGHPAAVVAGAEALASPIPVIDLLAASIEAVVATMRP